MRILIRYNYAAVELGDNGKVVSNQKAVCGSTVSVLMSGADRKRFAFAGFKPRAEIAADHVQLVKVLDVMSFTDSSELFSGNTTHVPLTHYCVGVFEDYKVWLLVEEGKLITRPLDEPEKRKVDNVVDLNHYRRTLL